MLDPMYSIVERTHDFNDVYVIDDSIAFVECDCGQNTVALVLALVLAYLMYWLLIFRFFFVYLVHTSVSVASGVHHAKCVRASEMERWGWIKINELNFWPHWNRIGIFSRRTRRFFSIFIDYLNKIEYKHNKLFSFTYVLRLTIRLFCKQTLLHQKKRLINCLIDFRFDRQTKITLLCRNKN